MFPRTRDAAPTGVYNLLHESTVKEVYTLMRERMLFTIGISVGFLLSGVVLALGISSVLLLSPRGRSLSKRDVFLRASTIALLFFIIAFQLQTLFKLLIPALLFFQSVEERQEAARTLTITGNATLVVIAGLTDGLLVWRCFMVQRVLSRNSSKWGNIFWIFPACLWIITIATAIAASAMVAGVRSALGYTANIVLNLYATLFICVRLLLHRRRVMSLGPAVDTTQHIYIIGILLESAAINVPVTLICAVGVGVGFTIEDTMLPIAVASQALASVLIIYQAAMGKALSRQRDFEIQGPSKIGEHDGSRSSEPTA